MTSCCISQRGYIHGIYIASPLEIEGYSHWEYDLEMSTDRRPLTDLEKAECAALKAEIAARNSQNTGGRKLTQEFLAQELGMTQGNLSSHLNGKRAISKDMAAKAALLLGIPVDRFSRRLADEIATMAQSVQPTQRQVGAAESQGSYSEKLRAGNGADEIATALATLAALTEIQAGLLAGQLTDDQVRRLLQIRNEVAHQKPVSSDKVHRLQGLLAAAFQVDGNGDSPDDLLKMYQMGMEKAFAKEGAKAHEPGKKPARRS